MSNALITGAGGFTGRYMAAELAAHGWRVAGLFAEPMPEPPAGFAAAATLDLLDRHAVRDAVARLQPQVVVHLAGIAFVAHGNADEIYRTNIVGTRNLLEALAALPVAPAMTLLASSANVYGNSDRAVLDEATAPAPANDYAVSKLAMEHMARLYMDRLPIVLARPFNYTGVGQSDSFLIPKIVGHARRGADTIELGNIDVARDFSDVRAVVRAYRLLLDCPAAAGRPVNVCSGRAHTLREVLAMVRELTGREMEVRVNPAFVRANEVRVLQGSRAALESLVGPVAVTELRQTLAWMLGQAG
jgi:nucleoside-diphosphate-sugar epimerase